MYPAMFPGLYIVLEKGETCAVIQAASSYIAHGILTVLVQ
jgi:hypothetical protein